MNCKCYWLESVVAIVVFVLALWPGILGAMASKWILVIAAVVLFLHAWGCKRCKNCDMSGIEMKSTKKRR